MKKSGWIPRRIFRNILQLVPIPTVDFVIVRTKNDKREFLLGKRSNKPYRGRWFVPGGRVLWGETLEEAAGRQLKRELGITLRRFRFVGHCAFVNPPGNLGVKYHTILHVYRVELPKGVAVQSNQENRIIRWFTRIKPNWPKPVREILRLAGFT